VELNGGVDASFAKQDGTASSHFGARNDIVVSENEFPPSTGIGIERCIARTTTRTTCEVVGGLLSV
jgi:hypothetical protein